MTKILVTGATGFVGTALLPKLEKYDISIVVRNFSDELMEYNQIIYNDELSRNIKEFNPTIVIHLASYLTSTDDVQNIRKIIDSNILFTSLLLEALKDTQIQLFINTGTFAEYYLNDGVLNPAYFYSASKIAVRPIIKYFKNLIGFKSINIIPYTIYGGKSKSKKIIDYIIDSTKNNGYIDMTGGEQVLDFIHIDDVVDFYMHCINNNNLLTDECDYHLGTGVGTSIKNLSLIIEKQLSKKTHINWGMKEYRDLDIMKAIAPVYRLEKELNWKASISLEYGIKDTLKKAVYND